MANSSDKPAAGGAKDDASKKSEAKKSAAASSARDTTSAAKEAASWRAESASKKAEEKAHATLSKSKDEAKAAVEEVSESSDDEDEGTDRGKAGAPTGDDGRPPSGQPSYRGADSFAYAPPVQARVRLQRPGEYSLGRVFSAEFFGAFVLVLAGLGIGMYNALSLQATSAQEGAQPQSLSLGTSLGGLAVALGFGLGVMVSAYAFGWISGGHFNPAVTLGSAIAGRTRWARVPLYWLAQLVGSFAAAGLLWVIARSLSLTESIQTMVAQSGYSIAESQKTLTTTMFASVANGWGAASTGSTSIQFPLVIAILAEIVVTMIFVLVILGATAKKANNKFAPLAIGLTLTVGLMILMPITNGSMNPTRSLAAGAFAGWEHFSQSWLFVVGPLLGGALAGLLYPLFGGFGQEDDE